MIIRIRIKQISKFFLFYAVSIALTLSAESVWLSNNPASVYAYCGIMMMIACLKNMGGGYNTSKKHMSIVLVYFVLSIFYILSKGNGSITGLGLLLIFFPLCFLLHFGLSDEDEIKLLEVFVKFIYLIAFVSLFFWFLGSVFQLISPTGDIHINWGNRTIPSYYNLYFAAQGSRQTLGLLSLNARNTAIFVEAPVSSFVFSTALLINVFYCRYKPKSCNSILIVAILSTQSTTGWIVLILLLIYFVANLKIRSRIGKALMYVFLVAVLLLTLRLIFGLILSKMTVESGIIRVSNLLEEIYAFSNNVLIGNGFGTYTYGSSNSITALLADGGIILWGFYYFPIIFTIIKKIREKQIDYFTIIFACMFAVTVMHYTIMCIFIITMLWRNLLKR